MYLLYIALIIMFIMSIITFCFFLSDKKRARAGAWRIKERTLILLSFLGGSIGAVFGMFMLRHKTKHLKFLILVPLSLLIHLSLVIYLLMNHI